jgi:hypothetical protein
MDPLTITAAIEAAISLIGFITKARTDLDQNAESTPEQRAALDAKIASIPQLPHWQVND